MKLASLRHGRDGKLVVVSDDLAWCTEAGPEVPTMQAALDDCRIAVGEGAAVFAAAVG